MAHEIFTEDGKASMFYVGGRPWHGLGTELKHPPRTAAAAIHHANLDWDVVKVPLYGAAATRLVPVPGAHAVVRADRWGTENCPVFGLVGDDYTPVQNREAFQFFDPLIESGLASYHTAGALGRGERIWVLVKVAGRMEIASGDTVEKYVLLSNSHDGRSSLHLKFTPVRVVCANTLTLALSKGTSVQVSHRPDVLQRLKGAGAQLGLFDYTISGRAGEAEARTDHIRTLLTEGFVPVERTFRRMAARALTDLEWHAYLKAVFPDPRSADPDRAARAARTRALASHLGRRGAGNDASTVRGSLWAAYNGVTELLDHRAPRPVASRPAEASPAPTDKHLRSIWFGQAANLKARAFQLALVMLREQPRSAA